MQPIRSNMALIVGLALGGCAATPSAPVRHYVVGENATLCFEDDARSANALLSRDSIRDVQPLYALYSSHGSAVARLEGATIELRGAPGFGVDRVQNLIECHRQAVARGAIVAPPDDPYALSDDEVRVKVEPGERGGTVVKLSCPQIEDAREILARASALIGRPSPIATR